MCRPRSGVGTDVKSECADRGLVFIGRSGVHQEGIQLRGLYNTWYVISRSTMGEQNLVSTVVRFVLLCMKHNNCLVVAGLLCVSL